MTHADDPRHEFTRLYHAHFGVTLSPDEAREAIDRLVRLYRAVYGVTVPLHAGSGPVDNGVLRSAT